MNGREGCVPILFENIFNLFRRGQNSREGGDKRAEETGKLSRNSLNKFVLSKFLERNYNSFVSVLHTTNLSVHLSDVSLCISFQRIMFFRCSKEQRT